MQEVKIEAAKKRIEDKLKKRKELLIKLKKLNKIREKESVLRHLDLLSEINTLKNLLGGFSTSEIIHHEFNTNSLEDDNCSHDLWFYVGSFSSPGILNGHFQNEVYLSDEEQIGFTFNRYICMDCGKYCDVKDWKDFENKHQVLKSYDKPDFNFYLNLYHQLLYTTSNKETINILEKQLDLNGLYLERKR